ncbi:unnamed protein product, partial [Musa hybrid cultivar]
GCSALIRPNNYLHNLSVLGIYQGQQQPPGNRHLEINPKEKLFGC